MVDTSGAFTARCFAETNGCTLKEIDSTPSPCVVYDGCPSGKPVKWCHIDGLGHAPWDHAFSEAWSFFNAAQ